MFKDGQERRPEKGILRKSGEGWKKVQKKNQKEVIYFIGERIKCRDEVSSPEDSKLSIGCGMRFLVLPSWSLLSSSRV